MRVVVDGEIYSWQRRGGISRIYNEVLPRMCRSAPELRVQLLTDSSHLAQSPPTHPQIHHRRIPDLRLLRPRRLFAPFTPVFERAVRRCYNTGAKNRIWHSTYYTLPQHWKGITIVPVYDLLHFRFAAAFNTPHDDAERKRMSRCVEEADCIVAISDTTRSDIGLFHGTDAYEKTRVIPLACGDSFAPGDDANDETETGNARFLLFVGDRNHYKNFILLLRAFARWRERDVHLVVVGERGWSEREAELLQNLKIHDRVRWAGSIDDGGLIKLYRRALAFVFPSLFEGFGIPLLEAMACGCTIVASRIPSTFEVAKDCPIYFDPTSVESLVDAFEHVVEKSNQLERRELGMKLAREYSWAKTAQQTLLLYRELLS